MYTLRYNFAANKAYVAVNSTTSDFVHWLIAGTTDFVFYGPNPASFSLFSFLSHEKYSTNTTNDKSIDGELGTWTQGNRMVGADESTELWRYPTDLYV